MPHLNEKYPINLTENKCLECHMKQPGKDEAKSVEMPESHYTDRAGKMHAQPVGARHFCTQCHAAGRRQAAGRVQLRIGSFAAK